MFTGLIEEVGGIERITTEDRKRRIIVSAREITREVNKGDSVAVSGVCLTAVEVAAGASFTADLAEETWTRTSFARLREGARVNLELPVRANARLGGHIVQGHVDGTGQLLGLEKIAGADDYWLRLELPPQLERYVVHKGSLAVEGISLTVARVEGGTVTIAIIPHTCENTNLHSLQLGDPLNLEVDIIAKYVEKMAGGERAVGALFLEKLIAQDL